MTAGVVLAENDVSVFVRRDAAVVACEGAACVRHTGNRQLLSAEPDTSADGADRHRCRCGHRADYHALAAFFLWLRSNLNRCVVDIFKSVVILAAEMLKMLLCRFGYVFLINAVKGLVPEFSHISTPLSCKNFFSPALVRERRVFTAFSLMPSPEAISLMLMLK